LNVTGEATRPRAPTGPGEAPELAELRVTDSRRLEVLAARIRERQGAGRPCGREQQAFVRLLEESRSRAAARRAAVPRVSYPPELPVSGRADEIRAAIDRHPVVVICGETGSGKTTQIPKACLEIGRGLRGLIGHTQPRRIAARSVAARLAEELGVPLGAQVGFKVRFAESGSDSALIRVMTDGILLAEVREDPDLTRYDTLIIDEAHERSLNIDFLLGYLKRLLPRRPDLRLVITSATIDPASFAQFFGGAPVIEVSGRGWPIETRYRPLGRDEDDDLDPGLERGIVAALRELMIGPAATDGDVLVFLPGEREIREATEALAGAFGQQLELLPLFSRLSWTDQQRVFQRGSRRRVVLATNVAETSITVPGIRAVVDSGLARVGRYSPRSKVLRLPIEPVSRASADQRKGRCGRVGPGVCIRLYAEDDFEAREPFTPPEILRSNLASVILQMEVLGLGAVDEFPFPDPPDTRLVNDGYRLLQELEAVDATRGVTELGRQMARLPLDPRFARMLAEGRRTGALAEATTLVAALSIQDPRERPQELRAAADERHAQFADARSDFMTLLNIWNAWRAVRAERSASQARRWCREQFLSALRIREWEDLRAQVAALVVELGWQVNEVPASYEALHRALLPGLLGNLGERSEKGDYLGARGLRFAVARGGPKTRGARWIMAASLAETHRVLARTVAAIEPAWIETAAHHLVRRQYGEAEWDPTRGHVVARETVTLYGLTIAAGRRVDYGRVAPQEAHRLFIREALVHGRCRLRARFLAVNTDVRAGLEALEARLRRRGVLLDEERIEQFYAARVPGQVHALDAFERWRRQAEKARPRLLEFSAGDILPPGAPEVDRALLPDRLELAGHALPLCYRFEPGASDDGATVEVPLPLLSLLDAGELEWGVPAWRHEKLTACIRGLPKSLRRDLVPAPDVALRCLAALGPATQQSFFEAAAAWLGQQAAAAVTAAMLREVQLPEYLRLNLRVLDLDGRVVGEGRDLATLKDALRALRGRALAESAADFVRDGLRDWNFETLPDSLDVRRDGLRLTLYPALEDRGGTVARVLAESPVAAAAMTFRGVRRLLAFRLEPQLRHVRKALAADTELALLQQGVGAPRRLADDLCDRAVERCCLAEAAALPRDRQAFEACAERGRPEVYDEAMRLRDLLKRVLAEHRAARRELAALPEGIDPALARDCVGQLAGLVHEGFVGHTPDPWLDALPRFLTALRRRIGKLPLARGTAGRSQYDLYRWRETVATLMALAGDHHNPPPELAQLRWMVEELAVSLFAQDLRTSLPVSDKRLAKQLAAARAAVA
jgi:ATP-dependent helicase HrpA